MSRWLGVVASRYPQPANSELHGKSSASVKTPGLPLERAWPPWRPSVQGAPTTEAMVALVRVVARMIVGALCQSESTSLKSSHVAL